MSVDFINAAEELERWIRLNDLALLDVLENSKWKVFVREINRITGLDLSGEGNSVDMTLQYGRWLDALRASATPIKAPEPAEPTPSLPAECWATTEFNAEAAHAAVLALCRGT